MNWDETLAVISISGFAVQRTLDILDFLIVLIAFGIKTLLDKSSKLSGWAVTELDIKKWLTALIGFGVGLLIMYVTKIKIVSALNAQWGTIDVFVGALAISGGSEGFNSVLKFAGFAKEARKVEVRPLPEVKVTPAATVIVRGASIQILASVAGTDNKEVTWKLLEEVAGANVNTTGLFTAPSSPGIFHVAAISTDNPDALAVATITVQ